MARRLEKSYKDKNIELTKEIYKQLDNNYPKKGRRVANLIKAGYFDELVLPMIEICKNQHQEKYKEKFKEFYLNILTFFPTAIFVNNETNEEQIEEEISKRLRLKTIPMIRIHSIGKDNIKKVEKVIEKIRESAKFDLKDKRFVTSTGIEAQNLEILIKKNYSH